MLVERSSIQGKASAADARRPAVDARGLFLAKFKAAFGVLIAINISVGAFIFFKTRNKSKEREHNRSLISGGKKTKLHHDNKKQAESTDDIQSNALLHAPSPIGAYNWESRKLIQISADEQQELFKWILEEKRKVKPVSESDKARINEEKALLKKFLKSKEII